MFRLWRRADSASGQSERPIVVASKPFAESFVLAEMFAQLLEERGYAVDRRPGLGATEIAFEALRTDQIDVYPEYTGTGLLAILGIVMALRKPSRLTWFLIIMMVLGIALALGRKRK